MCMQMVLGSSNTLLCGCIVCYCQAFPSLLRTTLMSSCSASCWMRRRALAAEVSVGAKA